MHCHVAIKIKLKAHLNYGQHVLKYPIKDWQTYIPRVDTVNNQLTAAWNIIDHLKIHLAKLLFYSI